MKKNTPLNNAESPKSFEINSKLIRIYPFENICIEGGGARIIAIGGTLIELEKHGILQKLKRFAGTSAGAIIATALAIGYSGNELSELLCNTDFSQFMDNSFGIVRDMNRLCTKYGYCTGDNFHRFASEMIAKKTYNIRNGNITFKELYDISAKELVLVATNLSKDKVAYLSRFTTPNMPVSLGVRASMSIPFVYVPVTYDNDVYCDGGMSMNYALQIFDGDFPKDMDNNYAKINPKTLGLKFMGQDERRNNDIYMNPDIINNIFSYGGSILNHMLNRLERIPVKSGYWERSMTIPTGVIGTLDFKLSKKEKITAQKNAIKVAISELNYFYQNKKFPNDIKIEK
jgi:NTE family protein